MQTVEEHDAAYDEETGAGWRQVMQSGIDIMRSRY
jgi:hypothetical protein